MHFLWEMCNKASHQHLFHKLHHYGIRGDLFINLVRKFCYYNRVQQLVVDGQQSYLATVSSSVPQGTFLAPLLFLCFINGIPSGISSKIKLYADNVLLYTNIYSQDDCHNLQQDLNLLEEWATKWKMMFNLQNVNFSGLLTKVSNLSSILNTE